MQPSLLLYSVKKGEQRVIKGIFRKDSKLWGYTWEHCERSLPHASGDAALGCGLLFLFLVNCSGSALFTDASVSTLSVFNPKNSIQNIMKLQKLQFSANSTNRYYFEHVPIWVPLILKTILEIPCNLGPTQNWQAKGSKNPRVRLTKQITTVLFMQLILIDVEYSYVRGKQRVELLKVQITGY